MNWKYTGDPSWKYEEKMIPSLFLSQLLKLKEHDKKNFNKRPYHTLLLLQVISEIIASECLSFNILIIAQGVDFSLVIDRGILWLICFTVPDILEASSGASEFCFLGDMHLMETQHIQLWEISWSVKKHFTHFFAQLS